MGLVVAEGLGVHLQGIDDREHVADPGLPVQRQLIDAADGDVVADQGSDHGALREFAGGEAGLCAHRRDAGRPIQGPCLGLLPLWLLSLGLGV